jgi:hypothetical protein
MRLVPTVSHALRFIELYCFHWMQNPIELLVEVLRLLQRGLFQPKPEFFVCCATLCDLSLRCEAKRNLLLDTVQIS